MDSLRVTREIQNEDALQDLVWKNGRKYSVLAFGHRHKIVIVCDKRGGRKARFQNGDHAYFVYIGITDACGGDSGEGCIVIPVLPDGRVLMIADYRPATAHFGKIRRRIFYAGGKTHALGPFDSLEFPGGGINPGETPEEACLRELAEETGVPPQNICMQFFPKPIFLACADLGVRNYAAIAHLGKPHFSRRVATDGGLRVFAMTHQEVIRNIASGAISDVRSLYLWMLFQQLSFDQNLGRLMQESSGMKNLTAGIPRV